MLSLQKHQWHRQCTKTLREAVNLGEVFLIYSSNTRYSLIGCSLPRLFCLQWTPNSLFVFKTTLELGLGNLHISLLPEDSGVQAYIHIQLGLCSSLLSKDSVLVMITKPLARILWNIPGRLLSSYFMSSVSCLNVPSKFTFWDWQVTHNKITVFVAVFWKVIKFHYRAMACLILFICFICQLLY